MLPGNSRCILLLSEQVDKRTRPDAPSLVGLFFISKSVMVDFSDISCSTFEVLNHVFGTWIEENLTGKNTKRITVGIEQKCLLTCYRAKQYVVTFHVIVLCRRSSLGQIDVYAAPEVDFVWREIKPGQVLSSPAAGVIVASRSRYFRRVSSPSICPDAYRTGSSYRSSAQMNNVKAVTMTTVSENTFSALNIPSSDNSTTRINQMVWSFVCFWLNLPFRPTSSNASGISLCTSKLTHEKTMKSIPLN